MSPCLLFALAVLAAALPSGCKRRVQESSRPPDAANSVAKVAPPPSEAPRFVGGTACEKCHDAETQRWRGSHHDHAMSEPTASSVKGDFENSRFTHSGETVELLTDERGYSVRVVQAGKPARTLPIRYTFGIEPLQQYLVDMGGGRLQALSVAWDTRPKNAGGQRWFHLHPGEKLEPGHFLHWESPDYNWNSMCADCHSTNVVRGYDRITGSYRTEYSEIDVSCEACHGAGSRHVAWAGAGSQGAAAPPNFGFERSIVKPDVRRWVFGEGAVIAHLENPAPGDTEVEACAPCHSRRSDLGPGKGDGYHDRYRLALLEQSLYYADGQIREEVFEHGSFLQSKMYARGVVCSDCHEPHSSKLRAEGNALCSNCHRASHFDAPSHHFHSPGSAGAECVNCHMPERDYMVIDGRRDHRFAVPRPAQAAKLGAPNPCGTCHASRGEGWAEAEIAKRRNGAGPPPHAFAEALFLARAGKPGARPALAALVRSRDVPAVARATALQELSAYPSRELVELLRAAAADADPLVRRTAADTAAALPPRERMTVVWPLVSDRVRSVRIAAAGALLDVAQGELSAREREALNGAVAEYAAVREHSADRAEALVDLAGLERRAGRLDAAERLLHEAIRKDPTFTPSHVNLADLMRERGDEPRALETLRAAIRAVREPAAVRHALGLALVRNQRTAEALDELRAAHEASPESTRFGYVYAIALFDSGEHAHALQVLERLHQRRPGDALILRALIDYSRRTERAEQAAKYTRLLEQLEGGT